MGAEAYDDCIHVPCPRCQSERDAYCRNPMTDRPAQVPCLQRLSAAETDREAGSSTGSAEASESPPTETPGGSKPQHGGGR